jgi:hypothetical protein
MIFCWPFSLRFLFVCPTDNPAKWFVDCSATLASRLRLPDPSDVQQIGLQVIAQDQHALPRFQSRQLA